MRVTLQEQYLNKLIADGEQIVKQLRGCIVVSRVAGGFYYLGKAGSLRYGVTRASSLSVSDKFKKDLLEKV